MAPQDITEIARRHRESWVALQPFVLGVLGDFSGRTKEELPPLADRCFHDVRLDTVDALMASMVPIARVEIEDHLTGRGRLALEIEFRALADFEPSSLVKRVPLLAAAAAKLESGVGSRQRAAPLLAQLKALLEAEPVRELEARWRSLRQLLTTLPDSSPALRVRVLDLSKTDLMRNLRRFRGSAWQQSPLCRLTVRDELATSGGEPFNLLLGDYAFSHDSEDILCLQELGKVAGLGDCVFVAAAAPRLLGLADYGAADELRAPRRLFEAAEYSAWRSLRHGADAGELALVLPRVLARAPKRQALIGVSDAALGEDACEPADLLWSNAVYSVGARLFTDLALRAGFAGLPEAPTGGVISVSADASAVEGRFDGAVAKELSDLGLIVIERTEGSDLLEYAAARSLAISGDYLGWRMLCGRLMHGLRDLVRDLQGAASTEADYGEAMLEWLRGFVDPLSAEGRPPLPSMPLVDFFLRIRANPHRQEVPSRVWNEIDVELRVDFPPLRPGRREHCKAFATFVADGVFPR